MSNIEMPFADDLINHEAMVDLETLATTPDAHILTIGLVAMHDMDNTLYIHVKRNAEMKQHVRKVDPDTEGWWFKQSPEAQHEAFNQTNAVELDVALHQITEWFQADNMKKIWSHGSTFDVTMLENAYRQCNIPVPWRYWDVRDTRTVIDVGQRAVGKKLEPTREGTHHNALDDAIHQAVWINNILSLFEKDK
tara:strand:- start:128 stop:706 length:579 start_codon:yes stop_codon:yes gene_type:complete